MGIIKRNDKLYSGSADTAVKVNFVDTIAQLGAGTVQTAIEKLKGLIGTVPSGKTIEGQISELNANMAQLLRIERVTTPRQVIDGNGYLILYANLPIISGYTPIGVMSYSIVGSFNEKCAAFVNKVEGGAYNIAIGNSSSNSFEVYAFADILYEKI